MGRLVEIIDGVAAAAEFERRAKQAAYEVANVGKLTVQEGNPGDAAVNNWIAIATTNRRVETINDCDRLLGDRVHLATYHDF
jgi:hypothetical protein